MRTLLGIARRWASKCVGKGPVNEGNQEEVAERLEKHLEGEGVVVLPEVPWAGGVFQVCIIQPLGQVLVINEGGKLELYPVKSFDHAKRAVALYLAFKQELKKGE